jgi:predicted esterase
MPRQGLLALLLATAACKPAPHDISTVTFARPDVSILTIHGSGDDNVYVAQGERITSALRDKGADVELIRLDGRDGSCHEDSPNR